MNNTVSPMEFLLAFGVCIATGAAGALALAVACKCVYTAGQRSSKEQPAS